MMSRLDGEERRRGLPHPFKEGLPHPFQDKSPYPPPFLGPAPHTDMGYFKVQVCPLLKSLESYSTFLVFAPAAHSIKLTLGARWYCQEGRQTMPGGSNGGGQPTPPSRSRHRVAATSSNIAHTLLETVVKKTAVLQIDILVEIGLQRFPFLLEQVRCVQRG